MKIVGFKHAAALASCLCLLTAGTAKAELLRKESPYPVKTTIDRFESILKEKGFTIFARVDHSAGAKSVNQELRPTELIIFGNPAGGTPLIQAEQSVGLSLPLRALAWQDETGKVWLGYDAVAEMIAVRGVAKDHPAIAKTGDALKALTDAAVKN